MKNFYLILNIPVGSSKDAIKVAFRKLAHIHHPDKGGNATKFKEILEAYTTLMDDVNRKKVEYQYGKRPPSVGAYGSHFNGGVNFEGLQDYQKYFYKQAQMKQKMFEDVLVEFQQKMAQQEASRKKEQARKFFGL